MDIEELKKDREGLIRQLAAIQGAISYIDQKIAQVEKEAKAKTSEE